MAKLKTARRAESETKMAQVVTCRRGRPARVRNAFSLWITFQSAEMAKSFAKGIVSGTRQWFPVGRTSDTNEF